MSIVKPFARINRKIRRLNKIMKINRAKAKLYHADAMYYQSVIDKIHKLYGIKESEVKDGN